MDGRTTKGSIRDWKRCTRPCRPTRRRRLWIRHSFVGALTDLYLLGDDPFLRMQAFNLGMIDDWLTGLEQGVLKALVREDGTPLRKQPFCRPQSQMWLFAAYELIRTWRQRCRDMIKWSESGGLEPKLSELERNLDIGISVGRFGRPRSGAQLRTRNAWKQSGKT